MSLAQDLRTRRKHRGSTPWQLIQKIGRLERDKDQLTCEVLALTTTNEDLRLERNQYEEQLDRAGIDLSGAREDLQAAQAELAELRAWKANTEAVTAPPMHRDTTAVEDQATAPIDVRPLWDAHRPRQARQASWGRDADDTQPPPAI